MEPAADEALETLRALWGGAYLISHPEPGLWVAVSLDSERRILAAGAPGDLEHLMAADFTMTGAL